MNQKDPADRVIEAFSKTNPLDPATVPEETKSLIRYALNMGYNDGWKEASRKK